MPEKDAEPKKKRRAQKPRGSVNRITSQQQTFIDGVANGMKPTKAYRIAYPKASDATCVSGSSALAKRPHIKKAIELLRRRAEERGGSALLTLVEKRMFLARVVRCAIADVPPDSDLWSSVKYSGDSVEYKLPDKLQAIRTDNDLASEGAEANQNQTLAEFLKNL